MRFLSRSYRETTIIVTSSEFSRYEKICIEKHSCSKDSRYNFSFAFHLKEKPLELTIDTEHVALEF